MKKLRQKGFTLIEGLLTLVVLSLIVGVGYYIYFYQQEKENNTSTSQTTKQVVKTSSNKNDEIKAQQAVVKIPELGTQLTNLPASLSGLTYTSERSKPSAAIASVKLTTDKLASCSFGSLNRYSGTQDANMDDGGFIFIKQEAGSWLGYVRNGVPCSQNEAVSLLQLKLDTDFRQYIKISTNLQTIE